MENAKKQAQGLFLRFGGQDYVNHRKDQMKQHPEYQKRMDQRKKVVLNRLREKVGK